MPEKKSRCERYIRMYWDDCHDVSELAALINDAANIFADSYEEYCELWNHTERYALNWIPGLSD